MYDLMKPKKIGNIPDNPDGKYIYEIKYDGGSAVIEKYGDTVKIYHNKNPDPQEYKYPELVEGALRCLKDGIYVCEIVVFNKEGISDFSLFQKRQLENKVKIQFRRQLYPVTAMVYDIIRANGEDVTDYPLLERKKMLSERVFDNSHIRLVEFFSKPEPILKLKDKVEGIVIKDVNSTYKFGKRDGWFKHRFNKEETVKCVSYEVTPTGIVLITEDGRRINLAGHRSEIAKKRIDEDGEVLVEVSYHQKTKDGFRFPVVKRIVGEVE